MLVTVVTQAPRVNCLPVIGAVKIGDTMSLVENINRRKKAKKSRPKSKSTISPKAYADMKAGWPNKKKKKKVKKS